MTLHEPQTAAEPDHRGRLRLLGGGQFVVDRGEFAFDIIQKSQEPTSYVPFFSMLSGFLRDESRVATGLL